MWWPPMSDTWYDTIFLSSVPNFFRKFFWRPFFGIFWPLFLRDFFWRKAFPEKCLEWTMTNPNPWAFCRFFFWLNSTNLNFLHYVWDFTGTKPTLWRAIRSQVRSDWCAFRIGENIGTRFLGKTRPLLSSSNTMWQSHAFSDNSQSTSSFTRTPRESDTIKLKECEIQRKLHLVDYQEIPLLHFQC